MAVVLFSTLSVLFILQLFYVMDCSRCSQIYSSLVPRTYNMCSLWYRVSSTSS